LEPSYKFDQDYETPIIGVDEVGRGPLAGPVISAAIILNKEKIPEGINDSKKLSKKKREVINEELISQHSFAIGIASVEEIDKINILQASLLAMKRAVLNLNIKPQTILVDGNKLPDLEYNMYPIIKGDSKSISIAAASIIAKVYRDKLMQDLSLQYPGYYWEKNSGYGTKQHLLALNNLGVTPIHRKSFAPIYNMLN
jgi:ribonuclease HII|tara:strand:- start:694 stop:1287 length:594 start_codon:yes stop_codon:yes gene_type:complete